MLVAIDAPTLLRRTGSLPIQTARNERVSMRGRLSSPVTVLPVATFSEEPVTNGACSFTPSTEVTTSHGKQAIGTMHVGEKVLAYTPTPHKIEWEPVEHVWIHTDNDLVDLTITPTPHAPHSTVVQKHSIDAGV